MFPSSHSVGFPLSVITALKTELECMLTDRILGTL